MQGRPAGRWCCCGERRKAGGRPQAPAPRPAMPAAHGPSPDASPASASTSTNCCGARPNSCGRMDVWTRVWVRRAGGRVSRRHPLEEAQAAVRTARQRRWRVHAAARAAASARLLEIGCGVGHEGPLGHALPWGRLLWGPQQDDAGAQQLHEILVGGGHRHRDPLLRRCRAGGCGWSWGVGQHAVRFPHAGRAREGGRRSGSGPAGRAALRCAHLHCTAGHGANHVVRLHARHLRGQNGWGQRGRLGPAASSHQPSPAERVPATTAARTHCQAPTRPPTQPASSTTQQHHPPGSRGWRRRPAAPAGAAPRL